MNYLGAVLSGLLSFPHRSEGPLHGPRDENRYHTAEGQGALKILEVTCHVHSTCAKKARKFC